MKEMKIKLCNVEDAKELCDIICDLPYDVKIFTDKQEVNAKSIMDVFTIEFGNTVELLANSDDCDDVLTKLKKFEAE